MVKKFSEIAYKANIIIIYHIYNFLIIFHPFFIYTFTYLPQNHHHIWVFSAVSIAKNIFAVGILDV